MSLITNIALDADWSEKGQINEGVKIDRAEYPTGVKASDVRAWLKLVSNVARDHNKKVSRKLIKNIMFGDKGFEQFGVFSGNDSAWDMISQQIYSNALERGDDDDAMSAVARAELQTVDALWRDYLKMASDKAQKMAAKAVENEERLGGLPRLSNRQLISLGKGFVRGETDESQVYPTVRQKLVDYLKSNYGVNVDNLSQKDFEELKEMVEYIVDNVYHTWASEEMEEVINDEFGEIADVDDEFGYGGDETEGDSSRMTADDIEFDPADSESTISFVDDSDDEDVDVDLDDVETQLDTLASAVEQIEHAFAGLKQQLVDASDLPEAVQKALVKRIVADELQKWGIDVE